MHPYKHKTTTLLMIIATIAFLVTIDSAFATHLLQGEISADVDDRFTINAEPMDESTILITGHTIRGDKQPVALTVTAPNGNLVGIDQLTVDSDFNYMTEIKTNGKLWKVNGAYVITAMQGAAENNNFVTTKVEIVNGLIADFNLNYQIDGGFVSYIEAEPNSNSLIISVDTQVYDDILEISSDGTKRDVVLTIELPRKVIDAKIRGTHIDGNFVVLVDGVNNQYEEMIASSVRTLTIPFSYGSEEIRIMGTYVDPGFALSIGSELSIPTLTETSLNPTISEPASQDAKLEPTVTSSDSSFLIMFVVIAAVAVGAVLIAYLKGIF